MSGPARRLVTPEEYLAAERLAETKHELVNGEVYSMAGASLAHIEISYNLLFQLGLALQGSPCRPLGNDLRVKVPETQMYTYPDVTVVCGAPEAEPEGDGTIVNPLVIAKILSPSTESYDRGAKFAHYRRLKSLQAYILVSQEFPFVEIFNLDESGHWVLSEFAGLESTIEVPCLGVSIPLGALYSNVRTSTDLSSKSPQV